MKALIDIGTNSVRLLLVKKDGIEWQPVKSIQTITRLGQGVNTRGILGADAILRTREALVDFKKVLDAYEIETTIVTATSAVRDGKNRNEFINTIKAYTGWDVQVLTGDEEGRASFLGALQVLKQKQYALKEEILLIDIGGGSTEILLGRLDGTVISNDSAQAGAVRMTELCVTGHPIKPRELEKMVNLAEDCFKLLTEKLTFSGANNYTFVGVGGTITTLAALQLKLSQYDAGMITGFQITYPMVRNWLCKLAKMDLQTRVDLPGLQPGREDIIVAGLVILYALMKTINQPLVVSDGDLMLGLLGMKLGTH